MGGYFAKQNAHSGATPPQWRTGSSLSATIVAPFLYKNALLRNGFVYPNLFCWLPKPINNTCSIEQTKFEGGMWAVILRSKMPTRGRSPRNGVQAPACPRNGVQAPACPEKKRVGFLRRATSTIELLQTTKQTCLVRPRGVGFVRKNFRRTHFFLKNLAQMPQNAPRTRKFVFFLPTFRLISR